HAHEHAGTPTELVGGYGQPQGGHAGEQGVQRGLQLQPGQRGTDAGCGPYPKARWGTVSVQVTSSRPMSGNASGSLLAACPDGTTASPAWTSTPDSSTSSVAIRTRPAVASCT